MATDHIGDRIIDGPNQPNSTPRNLKDVAEGTVLVGQIRNVFDTNSQLEVVIDVELVSAEWLYQFDIVNEGQGQRTKEESTEVGMVVTSGTETSESVSASAGFSG